MRFPVQFSTVMALAAIAGITGGATAAQAGSLSGAPLLDPILIDFEDFAAGTFIRGHEWADHGVTLSVDSNRQLRDASGDLPLRLFDSNCLPHPSRGSNLPKCTGDDGDLATGEAFGTAPEGNVLIIQEDNSHLRVNRRKQGEEALGDPDDDARGGIITFTFAQAVSLVSLGILDFDDRDRGEGFIRAYTSADDLTAALTFNLSDIAPMNRDFPGNNSLRKLDAFGGGLFQKLVVEYPGSGAITHLEFQPVAPGGSYTWLEEKDSHRW
ncbi:MAG: hypothetical protein O3C67_05565 [Cyanobacteria bacterium]|nr:hypothetical protein [Cyanobacteriota bacterium]